VFRSGFLFIEVCLAHKTMLVWLDPDGLNCFLGFTWMNGNHRFKSEVGKDSCKLKIKGNEATRAVP